MTYQVLIVDDKIDVRETIRDNLLDLNCCCSEAETGECAQELLKRRGFHVIFLDIKLPGISGIELLKWARDNIRDLGKVIILTGVPEAQTRQEAAQLGAFRYLRKTPLDRGEIRKALFDAVGETIIAEGSGSARP